MIPSQRGPQSQSDLRNQDTPGTRPGGHQPEKMKSEPGANVPLVPGEDDDNRMPEGLLRQRKGPMSPTKGRKSDDQS